MSFFLALAQVGFLKHGYLPTLHEFFDCHETSHETNKKTKTIHVEYAGSGQYVDTFEVGPTTTFDDVIPKHHVAFHGHNGPQLYDLSSLHDQDTITIRKQVFRGELSQTLEGHTHGVTSVAWNSQGTLLASGSSGRRIKIWDSKTWTCIQTLEGHTNVVSSVTWNSQGTLLASGSWDRWIKIWDTNTWTCVQTLEGHTHWVSSVAWNSQGTFLVSGSKDKTIRIWDSKSWKCVQTLEGHTNYVSSVAWNSQGRLASESEDTTIKIWDSKDSKTWKCVHTLERHTHRVRSLSWNSQGGLASGCVQTIEIWK